jgi:hypothetical protein
MTHNEEIYSDPYILKPERYIDSNGELQEGPTPVYGFGRCYKKYTNPRKANEGILITSEYVLENISPAQQ